MVDEIYGNAISQIGKYLLKGENKEKFLNKLESISRNEFYGLEGINSTGKYEVGNLYRLEQSDFFPNSIVLCMRAKEMGDEISFDIVPLKAIKTKKEEVWQR